jgi:RimJ/RimL family protein N-acetyltransferase
MPEIGSKLSAWSPCAPPSIAILEGQYVALERLDAEKHSAALWAGVAGHDDVWRWLPDGPYPGEADLRRGIEEKQNATNAFFLAIVPKTSGRAEGYASYMRMEPAHGVIEVGNILLTPSLQRTTAATEVMYLMARHVFEELGYRRYEWKCNAKNEPSRSAALRLGFTFEGIFRQHMIVKGENRDTAWFAMLDHEWPARKKVFEAWLDPGNFDAQGRQLKSLAQLCSCVS